MNNEGTLEQYRRSLWNTPCLKEQLLFEELDADKKGHLTVDDLDRWMSQNISNYNRSKVERCFRRVDEDNDNKIVFDEFLRLLKPLYVLKRFEHYVPERRVMYPTKWYHETASPEPLRRKAQDRNLTTVEMLRSRKASKERKEVLVESEMVNSKVDKFAVSQQAIQQSLRESKYHNCDC